MTEEQATYGDGQGLGEVVTELHGIRSAIGELGSMLNKQDEYGLGYLLRGLRDSLGTQIEMLEKIEHGVAL